MARLSPYLQMLLAKRNGNNASLDTSVTADSATGNSGPVNPAPSIAPTTNLDPLIQMQSRTPPESATDDVRRYDAGLHPDSEYPAIWTPHKRSRGLEVLEGLGNVAASAVGVDLQRILHPRGTLEQQARRRLSDETAIQGVELKRRAAESDIGENASQAVLREAEARKIDDDIANPKSTDIHVGERVLRKRADGGYETVYEPPAKPEKDQPGFSLSPGEARFDHTGKLITERAPKPDKDAVDATGPLGEQESRFRANASQATAAASKAEAEVKLYIQQQSAAKPDYDPASDANVASMTAEAKRQRDFAADQTKRADDLTVDKIKAGSKQNNKPQSQRWSKSRWAAANQGANVDAAIKEAERRGLQVVD